jgi:hypothetical protein
VRRLGHILSLKAGALLAVCLALPMARGCGTERALPGERSPADFAGEVFAARPDPPTAAWAGALAMFLLPHGFGALVAVRHFRAALARPPRRLVAVALAVWVAALWAGALATVFTSMETRDADAAGVLCAGLAGLLLLLLPCVCVGALARRWFRGPWVDHVEVAGAGICLWWFGSWAIVAAAAGFWTRWALEACWGLWAALGASAVVLAAGAARLTPRGPSLR